MRLESTQYQVGENQMIKISLLLMKNRINKHPNVKAKVMKLLKTFPKFSEYLISIKATPEISGYKLLEYEDFILYFAKGPLEDHRGIGRVSKELYKRLENLSIKQNIKDLSINKEKIYFFTSIHWCPDNLPLNTIVMIHDTIPMRFPDIFIEANKTWQEKYLPIAKQAKHIVTISKTSAADIQYFMNIDQKKISIIYNGINTLSDNENNQNLKFQLPKNYFVYVGAYDKHKNLDVLLEALVLSNDNNLNLVLVGNNFELKPIVKKLKIEQNIIFVGRLSDENLSLVIKNSIALLFPSLYEGFGLPPFEAALLHTPSICSKRPAMTELLEDAAIFVEPHNPKEWLDGMKLLSGNEQYARDLADKAYVRAHEFTWEKSAQILLNLLKRIGTFNDKNQI